MRRLAALVSLCTWTLTLGRGVKRDVACPDSLYLHAGTCCLNCPAGTFVKQPCTSPFTRGGCERCDYGTYTEHDNGLPKCLQCSKCPPDQEAVEQCTTTRDTVCQCRSGSFCLPDQACEACRLCVRCGDGEVRTRNCTARSDAACRAKDVAAPGLSTGVAVLVASAVVALAAAAVVVVLYRRTSGSWKHAVASCWVTRTARTCVVGGGSAETGHSVPDQAPEDRGEGCPFIPMAHSGFDSRPGDTLQAAFGALDAPQRRHAQESDCFQRRLVPVNDDSLERSFDLFTQVSLKYHGRFFRRLGLSENDILGAEAMLPEDRMNRLLGTWMQKEGLGADVNHLLHVLLELEQRLTAENIADKAVTSGLFIYQEQ